MDCHDDDIFWYLIFLFSAKGKQHKKTFKEKKTANTVKPVLVVSGIKRHSSFLWAEYVASLQFPLFYSSEVAVLLNLLLKWACPGIKKKSAHKPHLRWSR